MAESTMVFGAVLGLLGAGISVLLIYFGTRKPPHAAEAITPTFFVPCRDCGGEVRRGRGECPWCRAAVERLERRAA